MRTEKLLDRIEAKQAEDVMQGDLVNLSYEIELLPGEQLQLPRDILAKIGPGRWLVTVQSVPKEPEGLRDHRAFFHGYSPEDEGLYDDYPPR